MNKQGAGKIIKIAGGDIIEIATKDILLKAENIFMNAGKTVNENGEEGISYS